MGFHQERCEPGGVRRQLGEARLHDMNRVKHPADSRDAEPDQLARSSGSYPARARCRSVIMRVLDPSGPSSRLRRANSPGLTDRPFELSRPTGATPKSSATKICWRTTGSLHATSPAIPMSTAARATSRTTLLAG